MAEVDQLATALAAAQAEMGNAVFNRINPHFKSQYADLAAIRDASVPALSKNGLAIAQYTRLAPDGSLHLCTVLMHKSGQYLEGTYPITVGSPQNMGSQLTYAKRYCWAAMVGISADDDDDGEAAETDVSHGTKRKSAAQLKQPDMYPAIEKAIRACRTVEELKQYGYEVGRIIADWRPQDKRYVREEYERHLTALATEEGAAQDQVKMTDFKKKLMESKELLDREQDQD